MPSINFDLKDVKPLLPLLPKLGLGEAPSAKLPDVAQLPPPPPQPTPAVAGFDQWRNDPQNAQKIAAGVTQPGQPFTPPAPPQMPTAQPMAAGPAPSADPMVGIKPMGQGPENPLAGAKPLPTAAQAYQSNMKMDMAANPDQYQKPMLKNAGFVGNLLNFGAAGLIGAGGGMHGDPGAGARWIGEQAANDRAIPAANAATYDLRNVKPLRDAAAAQQAAAQLEDTQSQTKQRGAAADKSSAQADSYTPQTITREQALAIDQPDLAGTQMTARDYAKQVEQAGKNRTSTGNNARTNTTRVTTTGMNNDTKTSVEDTRSQRMTAIADASNKTKTLIASMHDATSRSNNAATNATRGGAESPQGFKVPADVTKRAALASNVVENADGVESLIQKRPDILGSSGGRYTNIQQMIGSNDPDIHELGVRMHNIALASNGAHGVRSQGAIQKTEDELFNNFKSGPQGIGGALKATRGSMQTFLNDEQNFATSGRRAGGTAAPSSPPSQQIPTAAAAQLQEGVQHTFGNGQIWTKQGGKPVRIK